LTEFARKKFAEEVIQTSQYGCEHENTQDTTLVYKVWRFASPAKFKMVIWDAHDDTYKCTCKMFEFAGILCRHIIRVCQQNNVAQINPIYFIPRWRKDLSECDLCFRYIAESLQFPSSEQEPQLPDSANEHIESQPTAMYHDLNQYCREICRKAANVEQFQSTKAALAALLESLYTDTQSLDQKTSPTVQSGADRILNPPLSNPKGRKKETRKKSFAETASKKGRRCRLCNAKGHDSRNCPNKTDKEVENTVSKEAENVVPIVPD